MRINVLLGIILLAFLGFSVQMNRITPYHQPGSLKYQKADVLDIGAPDELQHSNYVIFVQDHWKVPTFRPDDPNLIQNYQFHQPPLYYFLAAGWNSIGGSHPTDPGTGFWLRLLNAMLGLGTLLFIFRGAKLTTGNDWIALLAVVLAGLNPMFIALHSACSNDPLLIFFCSAALAISAQIAVSGWSQKQVILLGLCIGLAMWTKTTGVALLALPLLLAWQNRERRVILSLAIAVVLILPWWIHNQSSYGDPFALKAFNQAFHDSPKRVDMIEMVRQMRQLNGLNGGAAAQDYWVNWFGWWTLRSSFGAFSQMDIFYDPTVYRVLSIVLLAALISAYLYLRGLKEDRLQRKRLLQHVVFVGIIGLLFIQFNMTYFQAQARYLFPAVASVTLLFGCGIWLWIKRFPVYGFATIVTLLVVGNAMSLVFVSQEFQKR